MENNEEIKQEVSTEVETPVVTSEPEQEQVAEQPVAETPAEEAPAPEQPVNPLIDATVKELNDKMGFRG